MKDLQNFVKERILNLEFRTDTVFGYIDSNQMITDMLMKYIDSLTMIKKQIIYQEYKYEFSDYKTTVIITNYPGMFMIANDLIGQDTCYTLSDRLFKPRLSRLKSLVKLIMDNDSLMIFVKLNNKFVFKNIVLSVKNILFGGNIYVNPGEIDLEYFEYDSCEILKDIITSIQLSINSFYDNDYYIFLNDHYIIECRTLKTNRILSIHSDNILHPLVNLYEMYLEKVHVKDWFDRPEIIYIPKDKYNSKTILTTFEELFSKINNISKNIVMCAYCGKRIGEYFTKYDKNKDKDGMIYTVTPNGNILHAKCIDKIIKSIKGNNEVDTEI